MGVPAFFRWLSKKYPSIVVHCVEEKQQVVNDVAVPIDITQPNPNDIEFDNLYLDMNGIIHPCCHPENKPAPKNEDEMMEAIFEHIDRLFRIVRPRKLLYMAIDGVAPRAKMNQQRSRRFRGPKESREKAVEIEKIQEEIVSMGGTLPPKKTVEEKFDSNCITPGTEFMFRLAECLRYYISDRLTNDPGWKNIKVILSDANCPGEGEHKIMDYIRRQRASPGHDPNTHHCLCGADADLIMLGLATHEPNFTIIREEFKPNAPRPCEICGQVGHEMKDCMGMPKEKEGENDEIAQPFATEQEFIFLRLNVLREYLEKELWMTGLPFPFDIERAIDDWVFMCFFVGNDFLPHLPSLQIREGAIDRLIRIYKSAVYKTGGYLTKDGVVNLERVQLMMTDLGEMEDAIFKKRRQSDLNFRRNQRERKKRMKRSSAPAFIPAGQYAPQRVGSSPSAIQNPRQEAYQMRMAATPPSSWNRRQDLANIDAAQALKAMLTDGEKTDSRKRKRDDDEEEEDDEPNDEIRLWEDGWRNRYYESKFDVSADDDEFVHKVMSSYVEGLCWVLRYYYQGCASWDWYYPFHYAPFASDFIDIGKLPNDFEKGTAPFKPMEQLMSVFPAASGQFLPPTWRRLMMDPDSPIIDFYPDDFHIDLNGKKYAWQGVALLPFVDEKRLLETLKSVYPDLTDRERHRNSLGCDRLFVGKHHRAFDFFKGLYEGTELEERTSLNDELTEGMSGTVWRDEFVCPPGETQESPLPNLRDVKNNQSISVAFKDPQFSEDYIFPAKMLPGAKLPPKALKPGDWEATNPNRQYRPQTGFTRHSSPRASLDSGGHRMVRHNLAGSGQYSNTPPPKSLLGTPPSSNRHYQGSYNQRGWQQQSNRFQDNRSPHTPSYGRGGYNSGNNTPNVGWSRNWQSQGSAYQQNQQRYQQQQRQSYSQRQGGYRQQSPQGYRNTPPDDRQFANRQLNHSTPGQRYPAPPRHAQRRY
ncbi:5'-3' exoribonuclease 2-like [Ptychodera flava]|uniref:5'-3' exoribonuclease 2-like n=1 Tax=Ptychodera flava TaxID=63121 RepID=UPI003969E500